MTMPYVRAYDLASEAAHSSTSFFNIPPPPPAKAMMDFLKWRSEQSEPIRLEAPEIVPAGVREQRKAWGTWGAKATIGRVPGGDVSRMPACDDAEEQPPAPCEATGECGDLLKMARRMEGAAKRSEQLMDNAVAAMQASKVLLDHAKRKARDILRDPSMSVLAEEDTGKHYDLAARMLWGPWDHAEAPYEPYHTPNESGAIDDMKHDGSSNLVTRYRERSELDKRAVEYLNLVEAQTAGPSSLSIPVVATLASAAAPGTCRRRHIPPPGGCSNTQRQHAKQCAVRRARHEAFLMAG